MKWFMDNIKNMMTIIACLIVIGGVWHMKADAEWVQEKFDRYDYRNVSNEYYELKKHIKYLREELKYADSDREKKRILDDIDIAEQNLEEISAEKNKLHERVK